jgi:hypothetical protein
MHMTDIFEIHGGLPRPLAKGALQMFFKQNGNGGKVGFATAGSQRNIVMIDNDDVARHFRAHLVRLRVRFQELTGVPRGVQLMTVDVPTAAQLKQLNDERYDRIMRALGLWK